MKSGTAMTDKKKVADVLLDTATMVSRHISEYRARHIRDAVKSLNEKDAKIASLESEVTTLMPLARFGLACIDGKPENNLIHAEEAGLLTEYACDEETEREGSLYPTDALKAARKLLKAKGDTP